MQAAEFADDVEARTQPQMERVAEDDFRAEIEQRLRRDAFTEPYVPTGMNAGVSIVPRGNVMRPRRARPSVVCRSNLSALTGRSPSINNPLRADGE